MNDMETPTVLTPIPESEWTKVFSPKIYSALLGIYGFERGLSMIDIQTITHRNLRIISQVLADSYEALPGALEEAIAEDSFYDFEAFRTHVQHHGIQKTLATVPFCNVDFMDAVGVQVICRTILNNQEVLLNLLGNLTLEIKNEEAFANGVAATGDYSGLRTVSDRSRVGSVSGDGPVLRV